MNFAGSGLVDHSALNDLIEMFFFELFQFGSCVFGASTMNAIDERPAYNRLFYFYERNGKLCILRISPGVATTMIMRSADVRFRNRVIYRNPNVCALAVRLGYRPGRSSRARGLP